MRFYSTNHRSDSVTLREAMFTGLAPDGGLYMPESVPVLKRSFIDALPQLEFHEIADVVLQPYLDGEFSAAERASIIEAAFNFPVPVVKLPGTGSPQIVELLHGPTLAFKDFGARFMAQTITRLPRQESGVVTILVATSGDTGGAVAAGFYKVPGVQVVVLYPSGKISPFQESQIACLGENIVALEIDGTFDDCQRIVKEAFLDNALRSKVSIAPANSISIVRLLPQSIYYFWARGQIGVSAKAFFSVPSGNFGNLTAGLLAHLMGLPNVHFLAATNANDVVPNYLKSGVLKPMPSKTTLSSAMDVGNPSNFARIQSLLGTDAEIIARILSGQPVSDKETEATITEVFKEYGHILDPHTAVGFKAAKRFLKDRGDLLPVVFATAHPFKFSEIVSQCIGEPVTPPKNLITVKDKKRSRFLPAKYTEVREVLANS